MGKYFKYIFLLAFSALVVYLLSTSDISKAINRNILVNIRLTQDFETTRNELDQTSFFLPVFNNQLKDCLVSFSKAKVEGCNVGLFKTSSVKKIVFNDLDITCSYQKNINDQVNWENVDKGQFDKLNDFEKKINSTIKEIIFGNHPNISIDFSLAGVADLEIYGFKLNAVRPDKTNLSIQSYYARLVKDPVRLELRGHAYVKLPTGRIIESNKIIWNLKDDDFMNIKSFTYDKSNPKNSSLAKNIIRRQ